MKKLSLIKRDFMQRKMLISLAANGDFPKTTAGFWVGSFFQKDRIAINSVLMDMEYRDIC
ncbi:MAG: hypothetical protein CM1200mP10_29450 [Candidatus Neomarinimicrobiota bacterium]|nr:MAG: hypothetical protein CM1200mP10_29450 [Candidatus Neomarinimicrobiota bacterium]